MESPESLFAFAEFNAAAGAGEDSSADMFAELASLVGRQQVNKFSPPRDFTVAKTLTHESHFCRLRAGTGSSLRRLARRRQAQQGPWTIWLSLSRWRCAT